MNARRLGSAALQTTALGAVLLGAAGCHKKTIAVSAPPPPPIAAPDRSVARTTRSAIPTHPQAPPQPAQKAGAPAIQPVPHGKPVSSEVGLASWYGPPYANRKGADGTIYDQNAMTAAHKTLPMGTLVRVTNLANSESVIVKITDRGPFVGDRIIDLSLAAAKATDVYRAGVAKVKVEAYAAPATPGVDPAGRWCVQIGAFSDPDDAVQLKNDLARRFTTAKVIEFAGPTGHWVRINLKSPDRATAGEVADSIHIPDPGVQPYVVRLN